MINAMIKVQNTKETQRSLCEAESESAYPSKKCSVLVLEKQWMSLIRSEWEAPNGDTEINDQVIGEKSMGLHR